MTSLAFNVIIQYDCSEEMGVVINQLTAWLGPALINAKRNVLFFSLQNHSVYDSTQFDTNATPINPLYAASLQSPDSITGYSIDSQETPNPPNGYQQWATAHIDLGCAI